jgi:hypothetical protein
MSSSDNKQDLGRLRTRFPEKGGVFGETPPFRIL